MWTECLFLSCQSTQNHLPRIKCLSFPLPHCRKDKIFMTCFISNSKGRRNNSLFGWFVRKCTEWMNGGWKMQSNAKPVNEWIEGLIDVTISEWIRILWKERPWYAYYDELIERTNERINGTHLSTIYDIMNTLKKLKFAFSNDPCRYNAEMWLNYFQLRRKLI